MIVPTPSAVPTNPSPEVVTAIGLVGPFRVRFPGSEAQLPHRFCILRKTKINPNSKTKPHSPQKPTKSHPKFNPNSNAERNKQKLSPSSPVSGPGAVHSGDGSACDPSVFRPYLSIVRSPLPQRTTSIAQLIQTRMVLEPLLCTIGNGRF